MTYSHEHCKPHDGFLEIPGTGSLFEATQEKHKRDH